MRMRVRRSVSLIALARMAIAGILSLLLTVSIVHAEALVFYATQSGKQTLDQGESGRTSSSMAAAATTRSAHDGAMWHLMIGDTGSEKAW
ncbi:MAG: hypothetical protein SFW09_05810 [Hyphomicrobiaceae bacterium]|nr:hypothetical protein [Hyphomicrobiaceae bacterium]